MTVTVNNHHDYVQYHHYHYYIFQNYYLFSFFLLLFAGFFHLHFNLVTIRSWSDFKWANNCEMLNRKVWIFWSYCETVRRSLEGAGYLKQNAYQSKNQTVHSQSYWVKAKWQNSFKCFSLWTRFLFLFSDCSVE